MDAHKPPDQLTLTTRSTTRTRTNDLIGFDDRKAGIRMFRRAAPPLACAALLALPIAGSVAQELKPYLRQAPAAQQAPQAAIPHDFYEQFQRDTAALDPARRGRLEQDLKARLRRAHEFRQSDEVLHYSTLLHILESR
jgi:hypothetical protein